jgi:hypothetical protein
MMIALYNNYVQSTFLPLPRTLVPVGYYVTITHALGLGGGRRGKKVFFFFFYMILCTKMYWYTNASPIWYGNGYIIYLWYTYSMYDTNTMYYIHILYCIHIMHNILCCMHIMHNILCTYVHNLVNP